MTKLKYKIKVWGLDCNLLQETDRELTYDEAKNFKVAKEFRGTIEEYKKETPRTQKKEVLGQVF